MKPTTFLPLFTGLSNAAALSSSLKTTKIPTSYESAVLARRILALTPLGTLSTIFPEEDKNDAAAAPGTKENRPPGLGGMPHGLLEYISDCEPHSTGNPTILALNIETTFKNVAAGSNISLAVTWTPPHTPVHALKKHHKKHHHSKKSNSWFSWLPFTSHHHDDHHHHHHHHHQEDHPHHSHHHSGNENTPKPLPYSPAALPRFSLLGYIEPIKGGDDRSTEIGSRLATCFTQSHPDAKWWLPGNRIHESHFVRLVVEQVYWIGGFGDRAYIGWIPVEEWRNVTREEWESVRLPGEKGDKTKGWDSKEWSAPPTLTVQGDL
ncbi:pyridoxamine 5'-phosphate oxidase-domain-containing protein [Podospora australis]|uniref:Pyridoxamine 5'-phosphate oxidase-domain-containing protein n=1 Tax=Podospora australis TaxID=1536484 RepID=A0AAN7AI00_9PEZI|nr:pyridoxamine 5'-phosphate oxidase-domain-containing protein [Podospora australis]